MILTILIGIAGLGLMVFVHELGHFVAAKLNGVHVEVFSLGWGTKLVGFTRGGTTYQISWFPIGGYCKMKGDDALRKAQEGNMAEVPHEEGSFFAAAPWRRIVISAFGPLFNVVFAILIFTAIWWIGFNTYSADNRVVLASDYTLDKFASPPAAAVAGLKTGDRITAIDGRPVANFQDIIEAIAPSPGSTLQLTVGRGSQTERIPITPVLDKNTGAGKIGIYSWLDPVVESVSPGSPAAISGIRKGDVIARVGDTEVRNSIDVAQALASRPQRVVATVERGGVAESVPLILTYEDNKPADIGVQFAVPRFHSPRLGPVGALVRSFDETGSTIGLTVKGIGLLFKGINLRNAVAGPLRITYYIGTAATSGFQMGIGQGLVSFFRFLSFLSVVLFLMNLLPIPAMDGGQIIVFLVEIARGRPVRPRAVWRIQFVGFSVLIALSLFITFSDILFFLGR